MIIAWLIEFHFGSVFSLDSSRRVLGLFLATAVGTAISGALLVGLLSATILANIAANPKLPPELQSQVDLDSINFISNDRLQGVMERTTAAPAQVAEAIRVNTNARLRALKIGLLIMAGIAMLAIFPAGRLPDFISGVVPNPSPRGQPIPKR